MIDIKELRIGNWILSDKAKPFQVYAETFNDIEHGWLSPVPIPLTEEWLQSFGFDKKTDPERLSNSYHYGQTTFSLNEMRRGYTPMNIDRAAASRKLFYVHELQNFFYCYFGKELELQKEMS